jgi:hypothetical protein
MSYELPFCPTKVCAWSFSKETNIIGCVDSSQSVCGQAILLKARISPIHDHQLQLATRAIIAVLEMVTEDPDGRKLSFVQTKMGTLLAWVNHGSECGKGEVTFDSDDKTVIAALKLKV